MLQVYDKIAPFDWHGKDIELLDQSYLKNAEHWMDARMA